MFLNTLQRFSQVRTNTIQRGYILMKQLNGLTLGMSRNWTSYKETNILHGLCTVSATMCIHMHTWRYILVASVACRHAPITGACFLVTVCIWMPPPWLLQPPVCRDILSYKDLALDERFSTKMAAVRRQFWRSLNVCPVWSTYRLQYSPPWIGRVSGIAHCWTSSVIFPNKCNTTWRHQPLADDLVCSCFNYN